MSRSPVNKVKALVIGVVIVAAGAGGIVGAIIANSPSHKVSTSVNSQNQTTEIGYKGQNGKDALSLLKKHATVQTKHYSFGDLVTAINGNAGNGPKYWTFYINGKEAQVGASTYVTKDSDNLDWKLQ